MNDLDVFHQVSLLGILKKEPAETLEDVQTMLVETGMFDKKEAKRVFDDLQSGGYVDDNGGLTFLGVQAAKEAEVMFARAGEEMSVADR